METTHPVKHIVITSIFPPTEAVAAFAQQTDYQLVVVGDRKSPIPWEHPGVEYLSVARQEAMEFQLARVMPYNHYCRKMLGYLWSIQQGADFIVDTDDDNIPKENWHFPALEGRYEILPPDLGFVNVYGLYTEMKIWPRGLPLRLINAPSLHEGLLSEAPCRVGIWQGLADEDPDVDAIYRLVSDVPCTFRDRAPLVLPSGTLSPFNSQNTMIRKELFPLLYLPSHVTFRFTDILRGFVAQPLMWQAGYQLGFLPATVVQKRNPHDYMRDFVSEIPMYEHTERVIPVVSDAISASSGLPENLWRAYDALRREGIVPEKEMEPLEAWLKDLGY